MVKLWFKHAPTVEGKVGYFVFGVNLYTDWSQEQS